MDTYNCHQCSKSCTIQQITYCCQFCAKRFCNECFTPHPKPCGFFSCSECHCEHADILSEIYNTELKFEYCKCFKKFKNCLKCKKQLPAWNDKSRLEMKEFDDGMWCVECTSNYELEEMVYSHNPKDLTRLRSGKIILKDISQDLRF